MVALRRLLVLSLFIVAAVSLHAQPCTWTESPGQIVENCGNVGVGSLSPLGSLHVRGTGQQASNPTVTTTPAGFYGGTLFLQDSGGLVGNGGFVVFGASQGFFAGIKGLITDGSDNTTGTLIFATRTKATDTFLTERMRILGDSGGVSIGTTANPARLSVFTPIATAQAFNAGLDGEITSNTNWSGIGGAFTAVHRPHAGVTNSGGVLGTHTAAVNSGAGSLAQTAGQAVYSGVDANGSVTTAYGSLISIISGSGSVGTGFALYLQDVQATTGYGIYQNGANDTNYFAGKVGIGTATPGYQLHVVGNARVDGQLTGTSIQATYQDVAEWVPSREDLAPGTVVVLDTAIGNSVLKSSKRYDTMVVGVVSAQPGILLGVAGDEKEQIATTGRVRVKVDATSAPIRVGDLLVTSDKPGMAMRSQPIDVGGTLIHRPGTIVGKALEALQSGEGEVLVLLSLQ